MITNTNNYEGKITETGFSRFPWKVEVRYQNARYINTRIRDFSKYEEAEIWLAKQLKKMHEYTLYADKDTNITEFLEYIRDNFKYSQNSQDLKKTEQRLKVILSHDISHKKLTELTEWNCQLFLKYLLEKYPPDEAERIFKLFCRGLTFAVNAGIYKENPTYRVVRPRFMMKQFGEPTYFSTDSNLTVADWWNLNAKEKADIKEIFRTYVATHEISNKRLLDLEAWDCQLFLHSLFEKYGSKIAHRIILAFKRCLDSAVEKNYFCKNPAANLIWPKA